MATDPDASNSPDSQQDRLALPAPVESSDQDHNAVKLEPGATSVKLDELGPMVVNSDGTLSRIANWPSMTDPERERTLRVVSARNKVRLYNEERRVREAEAEGRT